MPLSQTWPAAHAPQLSIPPHPSGIVPQFAACVSHVFGAQPH
jgi:hypothetical protein